MSAIRSTLRAAAGAALLSCAAAPFAAPRGERRASDAVTDLRELVEQWSADRGALGRFFDGEGSPARVARLRKLADDWRARIDALDFEALDAEGRVDWVLLRTEIESQLASLAREERRAGEDAGKHAEAAAITAPVKSYTFVATGVELSRP